MALEPLADFTAVSFDIRRWNDRELLENGKKFEEASGFKISNTQLQLAVHHGTRSEAAGLSAGQLAPVVDLDGVSLRSATFLVEGCAMRIARRQAADNALIGTTDTLAISKGGSGPVHPVTIAKIAACAREVFEATDNKAFMAYLDDANRSIYETREKDLQRLERMQEDFFKGMIQFTTDQQDKHQEFLRQREADYTDRQKRLEEEHSGRLAQLEEKEASLRKIRADLDERENRQARRDIYKEIKQKIDTRGSRFELTEGTKNRRLVTLWFTVATLLVFAGCFGYCFYLNVVTASDKINWIAVGSQIGFAAGFVAMATFFIRWSNHWFQKHADEEFKLKQLDLDIDRANWLVELAMEWKHITKSEIPIELIDKLSRSLFVSDDSRTMDLHPAETILSAVFGKGGKVNVAVPGGKVTMERHEDVAK